MSTLVAFLRGINVSGKKKIPMAELREVLTRTGLLEVRTYIQTGNVIFKSQENKEWDAIIQKSIENHFGWEVQVLIRTLSEIEEILNACPFPMEKKEQSYVTLLKHPPHSEHQKKLETVTVTGEEFHFGNRCVYFYSSHGYGNAKMNNNWFESKLRVAATSRNYKTLTKLVALMKN